MADRGLRRVRLALEELVLLLLDRFEKEHGAVANAVNLADSSALALQHADRFQNGGVRGSVLLGKHSVAAIREFLRNQVILEGEEEKV